MRKNQTKAAQGAQVNANQVINTTNLVQEELKAIQAQEAQEAQEVKAAEVVKEDKEAAKKFPSLKSEANKEAKEYTRSPKFCLNVVKEMFDDKDGKMRVYILDLGYTAKMFKDLNWQVLPIKVNDLGRTCVWFVLTALAQYAKDQDLKGEKAAKDKRKADREAAAEARKRMEAKKKEEKAAKEAAKKAEADRKNNSAEMLQLKDKVEKATKKANNRQKKANKK
jgi:hypothetical protein